MRWLFDRRYRLRRRLASVNARLEVLASHMQRNGYHQYYFDKFLLLLGEKAVLMFELEEL
jgi:hypothetical protein